MWNRPPSISAIFLSPPPHVPPLNASSPSPWQRVRGTDKTVAPLFKRSSSESKFPHFALIVAAFAFPAGALTETSPDKRIFIHNSFCNTWHSFNARRSNAPAFRGQKHDCLGLELSGEKKRGRLWKRARWLVLWGISNSHGQFEDEGRGREVVLNTIIMLTLATMLQQHVESLRAVTAYIRKVQTMLFSTQMSAALIH